MFYSCFKINEHVVYRPIMDIGIFPVGYRLNFMFDFECPKLSPITLLNYNTYNLQYHFNYKLLHVTRDFD